MPIEFSQIPSNLRIPFVGVEIDSSDAAGSARVQPIRALIIGQQNAAATQTADSIIQIFNASQAGELFGDGSLLHMQASAWFKNNRFTEVWAGVLDDDEAATASTKTLTVTGPASANGTIPLYINGRLIQIGVVDGQSANSIAAAINTKLGTLSGLPCTHSVTTNVVTLTTKVKGAVSIEIDVRVGYKPSDELPAGVAIAVATGTTGATNPDLAGLIAAIANERFDIIVNPYTDTGSLGDIQTELERRWDAMVGLDGISFSAKQGSVSTLASFGDALNSQYLVLTDCDGPSAAYEWSAALAAVVAFQIGEDVARPFTTLELKGISAPLIASRRTLEEQNALLYDGFSSYDVDSQGKVRIGRVITTYQRDIHGNDDPAYLDVNTGFTLSYIRRDLRTRIQAKYPRHKLADDGTRIGAGQAVVTPKIIKGEIVSIFRDWELRGLVEDAGDFVTSLIVERDVDDRTRVNVQMSPNLVNQLYVVGVLLKYIL